MQISSCVSPTYMDHQSDINEKMRAILIDWLLEVKAELYCFLQDTFYMSWKITFIHIIGLIIWTGSLQIWAYGWDIVSHCKYCRQISRAGDGSKKEASIGRCHSHAISLQIWGGFGTHCRWFYSNIR